MLLFKTSLLSIALIACGVKLLYSHQLTDGQLHPPPQKSDKDKRKCLLKPKTQDVTLDSLVNVALILFVLLVEID